MLERYLIGFLVIGEVRGRVFPLQVFTSRLRRLLCCAAFQIMLPELAFCVEVPATRITSKLVGAWTCR